MFTHTHLYTETLLRTNAFTHQRFYKDVCTYTLLHTNSFTHKHFYTQLFYTQTLLHTNPFTHNDFYTRTSFRAKGLPPDHPNSQKRNSVFDTRTSFRVKRWPCCGASSTLPAALREERKRRRETMTKGESQREGAREREQKKKERRCEDEKMRRRYQHAKMYSRPPLLEEPFAQTLSGKRYEHKKSNSALLPTFALPKSQQNSSVPAMPQRVSLLFKWQERGQPNSRHALSHYESLDVTGTQ